VHIRRLLQDGIGDTFVLQLMKLSKGNPSQRGEKGEQDMSEGKHRLNYLFINASKEICCLSTVPPLQIQMERFMQIDAA
jgi:hypothetical protein